jgi:hypothetical protein
MTKFSELKEALKNHRASPAHKEVAAESLEGDRLYKELFDFIQPGQVWRLYFQPGNVNNKIIHIRGVVDDRIAVRRWNGGRWRYRLESIYFFSTGIESGYLTLDKTPA